MQFNLEVTPTPLFFQQPFSSIQANAKRSCDMVRTLAQKRSVWPIADDPEG